MTDMFSSCGVLSPSSFFVWDGMDECVNWRGGTDKMSGESENCKFPIYGSELEGGMFPES